MKNLWILAAFLFVIGCDDDPEPIKPAVEININHTWNDQSLELNKWYTTAQADSFMPTVFLYHLNNVVLVTESGKELAYEDWHLVNYSEGNYQLKYDDLEDHKVKSIKFTVGVEDSIDNYDGTLNAKFTDPMYWGMAMGYINVKLEGNSMKDGKEGLVYYHIGGYSGSNQTARNITLELPKSIEMAPGSNVLNLDMNLAEFFSSPNEIDISVTNNVQTVGADAVRIAQNWDNMFSVE
jgi:hypothetical protein